MMKKKKKKKKKVNDEKVVTNAVGLPLKVIINSLIYPSL